MCINCACNKLWREVVELFLPSGYTENTYGWINNVVFRVRKRYRYHLRSANSVIHFKSKPRQICKRMRILIEHEHRVYLRSFEYLVNILLYDSIQSNGILFITNQTLTQFNENTFAKLDYSENYCSCAFFLALFPPKSSERVVGHSPHGHSHFCYCVHSKVTSNQWKLHQ